MRDTRNISNRLRMDDDIDFEPPRLDVSLRAAEL